MNPAKENVNEFDFNRYVVSDEQEPPIASELQPVSNIPDKPFQFDQYVEGEESSFRKSLDMGVRGYARLNARVGETILGAPGDFRDFSRSVGGWIDKNIPIPKSLKGKEESNFAQKFATKMVDKFPTSAELKETTSKITSGFTDPQNAWEEFGDSIFELSALVYGNKSKAATKGKRVAENFSKAIAKATGAKTSGELAKKYGAGTGLQLAAEIATLGLMGLVNGKMANRYVGDKFKNARTLLPQGLMADTSVMTRELQALENDLTKGLSTPSKSETLSAVREMKDKVSGGAYPAEEIVDMMHDLNERMVNKKLFDDLGKANHKRLQYRYGQVKEVVGKEIYKIGKNNPEFIKEWSEGMEGFAVIENSKKATRTIEKAVKNLPHSVATGMAAEIFLFQNPQAAAAIGATYSALKSYELLNRVILSPTLRKHYLNVVDAAVKSNGPATAKGIARLDQELKKDIEKDLK